MNIINFLDNISQQVYDDYDLLNGFIDKIINSHADIIIGGNGHGTDESALSTLSNIEQRFYKRQINEYIHKVVDKYFSLKESNNGYAITEMIDYILKIKSYTECGDCGARLPWHYDFETNTVVYEKSDNCTITNEDKIFTITLDIPCGKLLIANDLRSIFGDEYISDISMDYYHNNNITGYISVNYTYGRIIKAKMMENVGMMFFVIGNDSPAYYQDGNRILFRDNFEDLDDMDESINFNELPLSMDLEKEKLMGSVYTDTWAISAMSYTKFKEMCTMNGKDVNAEIANHYIDIIDVGEGTYKCTCVYEMMDGESRLSQYAEIVKV